MKVTGTGFFAGRTGFTANRATKSLTFVAIDI